MKVHKRFKLILEDVQLMNTDKETKLTDYQDKLKYYNSKKGMFAQILINKPQEQWEAEAQKIIKGNVYLAKKWSLDKAQKTIDDGTKSINSGELTKDEITALNLKLNKEKQDINLAKQVLDKQIKDDLHDIQTK